MPWLAAASPIAFDGCPFDSRLELRDDLVLLDEVAPLDQDLLDHTGDGAPDLDHLVGLDDTVQGLRGRGRRGLDRGHHQRLVQIRVRHG